VVWKRRPWKLKGKEGSGGASLLAGGGKARGRLESKKQRKEHRKKEMKRQIQTHDAKGEKRNGKDPEDLF